jgi:uncharacterized protein YlxW (UPF0749 family)
MLSRPRFSLVLVFGVLGVMLAVAFNSSVRAQDLRPQRTVDLAEVVEGLEARHSSLEERLGGLRDEMSVLEDRAAENAGLQASFGDELERVRSLAGLTELSGPGVIVVIDDALDVPAGQDPNACVVHDFDVSSVVNALHVGGAEAVAVNGLRLVADSSIRCAGNTILVNAQRVGAPYEIVAIGDPDGLSDAVAEDRAAGLLFDTYVTQYGLRASVTEAAEVVVPAFEGSLRVEYAVPTEEDAL